MNLCLSHPVSVCRMCVVVNIGKQFVTGKMSSSDVQCLPCPLAFPKDVNNRKRFDRFVDYCISELQIVKLFMKKYESIDQSIII